ncbi:Serine hydroxymethyltransferase, mitochondrial, partial [Stegodyphus mimosarum]
MADMAHISGLVAAKVILSPFEYCDIVTTTTHKTLRGPRAGLIFYRKGVRYETKENTVSSDFEEKMNQTVFPGLQGAPHNNAIAGIATALKQAQNPEFKKCQERILLNAKALVHSLQEKNHKCVTGGTDNHIVWVDLRPNYLSGSQAEKIPEDVCITCNKN